jgi:predicted nucleotidyltransferase
MDDVRRHRDELAAIGKGYENIRVLGSVARAGTNELSDLHLLVDVLPGHGLRELSAFAARWATSFRCSRATLNGLRPRIRARVLSEAVPL